MRIWLIAMAAAGEDRSLDAQAPGPMTKGSRNTPRSSDATSDPGATLEGVSPNVCINGRPAVAVGDTTRSRGIAAGGQSNVFINGKPVGRASDLTSGCPSNSCWG